MPASAKVAVIVSELFAENCYILNLPGRTDCLIVDPGLDPEEIVAHVEKQGLTPAAILNTHGHCDHIAGNGRMKERWPDAPIVIGEGDAVKLIDADENLSGGFGVPITSPPADRLVREGDSIEYAGFELLVREIPGHSIGHVVFIWNNAGPTVVLGGDVLMAGSIGRTDFPDGDFDLLARGIRKKLYTLPDDTVVLPGHGPTTTTGREKQTNPFVGANAGRIA